MILSRARPTLTAHTRTLLRERVEFASNAAVLRSGPYRYYFFSHEPNEPAHVHVDREQLSAKFWLEPVSLASNLGFRAHELVEIEREIQRHRKHLLEAWHGYFGGTR